MQRFFYTYTLSNKLKIIFLIIVYALPPLTQASVENKTLTIIANKSFKNGLLYIAQKEKFFEKHGLSIHLITPQNDTNPYELAQSYKDAVVLSSEFEFLQSTYAKDQDFKIVASTLLDKNKFSIVLPKNLKRFNYRSELDIFNEDIRIIGISSIEKKYFLEQLSYFYPHLNKVAISKTPFEQQVSALQNKELRSIIVSQTEYLSSTLIQQTYPIVNNLPKIVNYFQIIAVPKESIAIQPEIYKRLLSALLDAEKYYQDKKAVALQLFAAKLGILPSRLYESRFQIDFNLALNQSILISLEEKLQWLADQESVPRNLTSMNSLLWIDRTLLTEISPDRVAILPNTPSTYREDSL